MRRARGKTTNDFGYSSFLFSVKIIGPTCKNEPRFYTQRGPANQRGPRGLPAMDRYPTTRAFSFLEKAIPLQFILFFATYNF